MRARYRWLFASVFALVMPGAWAAGGRIVFTGAVVEPTCAVDTSMLATGTHAGAPVVTRGNCGQTPNAAGSHYVSRVMVIDAASAAGDRLLAYFAGNQPAAPTGQTAAKLVVRTYE